MSELQDSFQKSSTSLAARMETSKMEVYFTQATAGKAGLSLLLHESLLNQIFKQQNKLNFQQNFTQ